MPLTFNVRHLAEVPLVLRGELPASELDMDGLDDLIHVDRPLSYELEAQEVDGGLLVQGQLLIRLACDCSRCLKRFDFDLTLDPWACLLATQGEDAVEIHNDLVDLTPHVREDILLAFPQHPLCDDACSGLPAAALNRPPLAGGEVLTEGIPSVWGELDKLKL